jgi:Rrf2 family protein
MNLKNQVEWALHCCAVLAELPPGRYLATKDLATFHGVPKEYLSKAMQNLSQAGIVETSLGPRGGYRLAKQPDKTTFLDIVEAIEGKRLTFVCTEIRKNNPCRNAGTRESKPCAVARAMWEADEAWRASLRGVRLSALLETVRTEVPTEQLRKSADWIAART